MPNIIEFVSKAEKAKMAKKISLKEAISGAEEKIKEMATEFIFEIGEQYKFDLATRIDDSFSERQREIIIDIVDSNLTFLVQKTAWVFSMLAKYRTDELRNHLKGP